MNQTQFHKAAGICAGLAVRWFPHIDKMMKEYGITAPLDQAMFIAQMGHESTGFTRLVENLNYAAENLVPTFGRHRITPQQAAALGRTATHPANQKAIANLVSGQALKLDLVTQPELLEVDENAARSAAWFYVSRGCLLHSGDVERVTLLINGGSNGLEKRRKLFNLAKSVLV